jgi:hypothetical protein
MTSFDGPSPEMPGHHDVLTLDDGTAERLLRGVLTIDDAPPAYRDVAVVIAALHAEPTERELAGERRMVPFIARRIAETAPVTRVTTVTPKRSRGRLRVAVLSGVAAATLLLSLAGAGALPGAAQRIASDVLGQVGVSVPSPDSHSDGHADTRGNSGTGATSTAGSSDTNGKGAEVSATAHSDSTGVDKGADVSSDASDGKSQAGVNGPESTPAGTSTETPAETRPTAPPPTTVDPNAANDGAAGSANASVSDASSNQP